MSQGGFFVAKIGVRQKQPMVRTNLYEVISVVGPKMGLRCAVTFTRNTQVGR